eukprot:755806-Hanusia_phi.AAC.1
MLRLVIEYAGHGSLGAAKTSDSPLRLPPIASAALLCPCLGRELVDRASRPSLALPLLASLACACGQLGRGGDEGRTERTMAGVLVESLVDRDMLLLQCQNRPTQIYRLLTLSLFINRARA